MKSKPTLCGLLAFLVFSVCVWGEQTPQQRPVFRSNTSFVSVDAYPRRDGKIVEGLTKADFEIFEDGKPQTVDDFEFIRVSPVTPDDERRDPTSIADGERQAADPHNRVFVVYLDLFSTSMFNASYARAPIVEFLTRAIGPKDLFAVMTPELPVTGLTFARRTESIESDLIRYWQAVDGPDKPVTPRNPYEAKLYVCGMDGDRLVRTYRRDLTFKSLEQLVARLGNLRDERKNILFVSEGWTLPGGSPGAARSTRASIPTIGVGPSGRLGVGTNMSGTSDTAWCDQQAAAMSGIDYGTRFRMIVNDATRANVAFYPVDLAGLRVGGGLTNSPVEMLHDLATATDGKAIANTNDLTGAVRKIADDLSAFYLLGYYTSNTEADGKFRRIEVKVKQPGVKVSARRGYLAPTAAMRKAEAEAAARPVRETTPVDLELGRLARLRTDARLFTSAIATSAGIDVVTEISSTEFSTGRWANGASVSLRISPKGDDAKEITAQGKIEPGTRGTIVKVPLPSTAATWRVRLRVEGNGETIEDEVEITTGAVPLVSEPAVFRAGAGPRSPLRPVADFKFFRTERLHVEWILSKTFDDRTARLLTRQGDAMAVPVTLTERADGDRQILAADLVLAPLADGDYVIEVTATVSGQKIQKLLAFRVVR